MAEVNDWTVFGQTECHVWFHLSPVKKDMSYFALENLTKVNLFLFLLYQTLFGQLNLAVFLLNLSHFLLSAS